MALTGLDGWIAAMCAATREQRSFLKTSQTSEGAGTFHSLWKATGNYPGAGATPPAYTDGSGYIPTEATAGAWPLTDPASGSKYLSVIQLAGSTIGRVIFYDRVWACSGMATNGAGSTDRTITTPGNVDRPSGGVGIEPWIEIYTAPGATARTWTLTFVDPSDANKTAVYAHPANAESVGQLCPMIMEAGVTGVKSPTKVNFSDTSGTAGDVGVTLLRRIAEIAIPIANVGDIASMLKIGLPGLATNTCLAAMVMCTATNTGIITGINHYCEG